jgi:hypothetical protein
MSERAPPWELLAFIDRGHEVPPWTNGALLGRTPAHRPWGASRTPLHPQRNLGLLCQKPYSSTCARRSQPGLCQPAQNVQTDWIFISMSTPAGRSKR